MAPADAGFSPHHCAEPHYWSQRALQEDKKKCLTDLPHTNHQVSNTLEFLHEDKKHHSCRAIADRKKLHQPLRGENWRRRPSTPTHPFAANLGDNKKKFWSHRDLLESKRTNRCVLVRPGAPDPTPDMAPKSARERSSSRNRDALYDDDIRMPQSARSPGSIGFSDMSRSQSVDFGRRGSNASGLKSPTMMELLQHDKGPEDHPHNELATNWWKCCREERDAYTPHRSHEKFSIKKQHHGVHIHEVPQTSTHRSHYADAFAHGVGQQETPDPDTSNRVLLYTRDPKGSAVQGQYPHCVTNEAWAPPRGDETPPSRYHSCELMALDRRRHATPIDGGRRWQRMRVECTGNGQPVMLSPGSPGDDKPKIYRSNFTMQQHKKKHLAALDAGRAPPPDAPACGNTPMVDPNVAGYAGSGCASGWSSHRELQYAKRFNNVNLSPPQQLHRTPIGERPWPKPGDMLKDDASEISGATPPYPSGPVREVPLSSTQRAHTHQAVSKYSAKSGRMKDADSMDGDSTLLHSSHQELALRKTQCSTSVRDLSSRGKGDSTARSMRAGLSASGSDLGDDQAWKSHQHLCHQKTTHRFNHDDPRRKRPEPRQVPTIPPARSGQWTPAHI